MPKPNQPTPTVVQPALALYDPDKVWYRLREIADMLSIDVKKLYPRINPLRRVGVINSKRDPHDDRSVLIHRESLPLIFNLMNVTLPTTGENTHV